MVRVLVTGSNGLLGTKVLEQLCRGVGDAEPLAVSRGTCANAYLGTFPFWQLDVTDRAAVERVFDRARPDVVVHTAAVTDVDGCERERDRAWATNAAGTEHVAHASAAHGAHLVYLSTEYVFDGGNGPYAEGDSTNPLGWYAQTKYAGEQAVIAAGGGGAVARTTVVFGDAPHVRANFVLWLIGKLRAGERVRVVDDQIGSPTLADNLAEMVLALGLGRARGIYHTAGATVMSRYEFARLAATTFELDATLIDPIPTASLGQPAPRPLRAGLKLDRFRHTFPTVPVRSAVEGLAILREQLRAAGVS